MTFRSENSLPGVGAEYLGPSPHSRSRGALHFVAGAATNVLDGVEAIVPLDSESFNLS